MGSQINYQLYPISSQFHLIKSHRFQINFQLFPTNFQSLLTSFQLHPIKSNKFPAKLSRSQINSLRSPRSLKNLDSWQMISPPSNHVDSKKKLKKPRSQSMKRKRRKVLDTENKFLLWHRLSENSSEKYSPIL